MCMVDMQREIDALYAYDEFGMPVYKNEKYTQPFGYTGYQMDEISELYLHRQDVMIPEQGGL